MSLCFIKAENSFFEQCLYPSASVFVVSGKMPAKTCNYFSSFFFFSKLHFSSTKSDHMKAIGESLIVCGSNLRLIGRKYFSGYLCNNLFLIQDPPKYLAPA